MNFLSEGKHWSSRRWRVPVRGHSNVQGDRTMGICENVGQRFLDALGREFGFEPPREPGLDTVNTIRAMSKGKVRVFLSLGGNFLSASPDTEVTARALQSCADRAHFHQTQSLAFDYRADGTHPPLPRPIRTRSSSLRSSVRDD